MNDDTKQLSNSYKNIPCYRIGDLTHPFTSTRYHHCMYLLIVTIIKYFSYLSHYGHRYHSIYIALTIQSSHQQTIIVHQY